MRPLFFLPNYTLGSLGPSRFRTPGTWPSHGKTLKAPQGFSNGPRAQAEG